MITEVWYTFLSLDLPPLLAASASAVACAVAGSYLLVRGESLMGDAISHSVLPGIVIAFLMAGTRASLPVFIGAAAAGTLAAVTIELVRKLGRVESSAAMGVVFSLFFALGVLLIEQAAARNVDLDADCLLHGQLESIFWYPPNQWQKFFSFKTFLALPQEVWVAAVTAALTVIFVVLLYKELLIVSFDRGLAKTLGFRPALVELCLIVVVASGVVAAFKVAGSILVIGMLVCPPATARMFTDSFKAQIWLSVFFAFVGTVIGYAAGAFAPELFGLENSLSASGMMITAAGILFAASAAAAPRYGFAARFARDLGFRCEVAREDLIGRLYRISEGRDEQIPGPAESWIVRLAARRLAHRRGEILTEGGTIVLTQLGRHRGAAIVRTHRLWESYLVNRADLKPDHVHDPAMWLEHFTSAELAERLSKRELEPAHDPHGRLIPAAADPIKHNRGGGSDG